MDSHSSIDYILMPYSSRLRLESDDQLTFQMAGLLQQDAPCGTLIKLGSSTPALEGSASWSRQQTAANEYSQAGLQSCTSGFLPQLGKQMNKPLTGVDLMHSPLTQRRHFECETFLTITQRWLQSVAADCSVRDTQSLIFQGFSSCLLCSLDKGLSRRRVNIRPN